MKNEYAGSMVVEASIIFPMIVILTWSLIYLLFRMYDRNVITEGRYMCALRADRYIENQTDTEVLWETKFNEEVINRLILNESKETALAEKTREIYKAEPVRFIRMVALADKVSDKLF